MRTKTWIYSPPKPKVPDAVKVELKTKATELIDTVLEPKHVKPPPKNAKLNYIVDLYAKWHGNYFYFCAKYACPAPNALSPFFEIRFARLEFSCSVGRQSRFDLSYMRHTGKWWEIRHGLSLERCLSEVREGGLFHP
jgi:hypothetical protein